LEEAKAEYLLYNFAICPFLKVN